MTVGNPENFKFQIKTGRQEVDDRIPCDLNNLTLKKLFSWIDTQQIGGALKAELKKSAARFPHQTLQLWQNDFEKHLAKAQSRLRAKKTDFKNPVEKNDIEIKIKEKFLDMKLPVSDTFDEDLDELDEEEKKGETKEWCEENNL